MRLFYDMKEWILSLSGTILLTTVFSLIIPNGKTASVIKTVFSFLCVFVFIKPVLSLSGANKDISFDFSSDYQLNLEEEYLSYFLQERKSGYQAICKNVLSKNDLICKDILIDFVDEKNFDYNINKITVYLDVSVIENKNKHINNKEKSRSSIAEYFGINQNSVVFYE